ncbi:MAG: precorrin-2 C(20)-methyltransferase [Rhodobacteraceae bacterium]|nr:precorrin-2 C(20)-methyltransferase [Paracoccaceae bacterium]
MSGKLIGVGLGPGDPELMTLKAHRLIASAAVIAYPALENGESFARSIAAGSIPPEARELVIRIPMTVERAPAQAAYDQGAADIAAELDAGRDVVVLCEGDPFFYGSFMYLFARLAKDYDTEVVPGVTSVTACAAVANRPLAARNEVLTIIPGPLESPEMRARIEAAGAVAIMKVGRHLGRIRALLTDMGLAASATYVARASLPSQQVLPLERAPDPAPYFSMILITKSEDPWLS